MVVLQSDDHVFQEIAVATAAQQMSEEVRAKIEESNAVFPEVLASACLFIEWKIPCKAWFLLLKGASGEQTVESLGNDASAAKM